MLSKETLIRRLAQRYDSEILGQVLRKEAPVTALPEHCITWTGAYRGQKDPMRQRRPQMVRTPDGSRDIIAVVDPPYGRMVIDGQRVSTHRLVYEMIYEPNHLFQMSNQCGNTLCGNPMHWQISNLDEAKEPEIPEDFLSMEFSIEEVEELFSRAMSHFELTSWGDVISNPLLLDCDPHQVKEAIRRAHKEHLLPHDEE